MAKKVYLTVDLGFGDAGKGSLVDYLVAKHQAHTVVRFSGGSQAAHNVLTPDGLHHTFAQFGSGSLVGSTATYLTKYVLVDPLSMLSESRHLVSMGHSDIFSRTFVDRQCLVITPYHVAANQIKEIARNRSRHGSCGMGVGETASDNVSYPGQMLTIGDFSSPKKVKDTLQWIKELKLKQLQPFLQELDSKKQLPLVTRQMQIFTDPELSTKCLEVYQYLASCVNQVDESYARGLFKQEGNVVFEAAQGVLLDEWYGFHPYTTWSTTTLKNAYALLKDAGYTGETLSYGLLRAYATRHGAGPFVTEDPALVLTGFKEHNQTNTWQQDFRVGNPDLLAISYALSISGKVDQLVLTNVDRLQNPQELPFATSYTLSDDTVVHSSGPPSPIPDLVKQEALTKQLLSAKPNYIFPLKGSSTPISDYCSLLQEATKLPVGIVSNGPTRDDKIQLV